MTSREKPRIITHLVTLFSKKLPSVIRFFIQNVYPFNGGSHVENLAYLGAGGVGVIQFLIDTRLKKINGP